MAPRAKGPDPYGTADMFGVEQYRAGHVENKASAKSVAQGNCPKCSVKKVGLTRDSAGHLTWRYHTYSTWAGTSLPCPAVGIRVCVAPEAEPFHNESGQVHCAHG